MWSVWREGETGVKEESVFVRSLFWFRLEVAACRRWSRGWGQHFGSWG